ncbi:MAG: AzlC family ABC transporter permease, partial [Desulfocucumaceae bacterium]
MIVKKEFLRGVKDALPIVLGYLPLGTAFGVLAGNYGLSFGQVAALSFFLYSGSGQFLAIGLLKAGLSPPAIISSIFLVNLLYLL